MSDRFKSQKVLAGFLVFLFSFILLSSGFLWAEEVTIVIVHTNDFHGRLLPFEDKKMSEKDKIGGSAYLASLIKKIRAEYPKSVLLLDAGDIAQGTPISNIFKGLSVIDVMNHENYDVGTIGNHEFDWGQKALLQMIKNAKFQIVTANIIEKDKNALLFGLKPYTIREVQGVKIAVIGVTTTDTPIVTKPSNVDGLEFQDPAAVVNRYYPIVKSKGAKIVIVLSHLGVDADEALAKKVKGVDLIVGGHSHTVLKDPKIVNNVVIVQTGNNGKYLGKFVIKYDKETNKIVSYTTKGELIPVLDSKITPDAEIAKIVKKYDAQVAPQMNVVVAEAKVDLLTPSTGGNPKVDSPLGSLVCDAMKEKAGSQITFMNAGGLRSPIYKGQIKVGDIFNLMPFDNSLVTMDLTGADVLKVLEQGTNTHGMVQVSSGTKVVYNPKAPQGSRIIEATVDGKPVDPNGVYRVTTIDFIASGGDGFNSFKNGKNLVYGDLLRDVLLNYFKAHSPIEIPAPGRIEVSEK
ncbi:MAG: 5'-nucleotidase C-terminal domain-containing protein [Firmicutes bacterium]|nr:5'-nucleotidase C-terminal domain-containing protein [Bacillota bacterium]